MLSPAQQYRQNIKEFHRELETFINETYKIDTNFSTPIAWGYQSAAILLEAKDKTKYIVKLTKDEAHKPDFLEKDIKVSNHLTNTTNVPVPQYMPTEQGEYILTFKDFKVRTQHHLEGVPAFGMNKEIIVEALGYLEMIHQAPLPDFEIQSFSSEPQKGDVLIHGDLTPSNILISFGKVSGILDFERAMTGPIEYDLGRMLVFAWFRAPEMGYKEIVHLARTVYKNKEIDTPLLNQFAVLNVEERIDNLQKHKNDYLEEELKDWEADYKYTTQKYEELKNIIST